MQDLNILGGVAGAAFRDVKSKLPLSDTASAINKAVDIAKE